MNQITVKLPYDLTKLQPSGQRNFGMRQRDGVNVLRQNTDLENSFRRTDEEILIVPIQSTQRSDDIPYVRTNAEIRDAAEINRNLHELI